MRCVGVRSADVAAQVAENSTYGVLALQGALSRLVKTGAVLKIRKTDTPYSPANFSINYNKLTLPREIMDKAPEHIKDSLKATEQKLQSGEYKAVDEFGAGIIRLPNSSPMGAKSAEAEPTKVAPPPEAIPEVAVEPVVEQTAEGRTISINLTINLNL